jgi:diguanylate cyclase (GGDEF)-like protein
MAKIHVNNLISLRKSNMIVAILALCFAVFPIVVDNNLPSAYIYFFTSAVAVLLTVAAHHTFRRYEKGTPVSSSLVTIMTILYYLNITLIGLYIGVWTNPDGIAATFLCILICALYLFTVPPVLSLCLTGFAMVVFSVSAVLFKPPEFWITDLINVLFAGNVALIFGWHITKLRILLEANAGKLEEERNNYYTQSTMDELTQLKNRRDFMQTFQRYLTSHRDSDMFLCFAIMDIDFFKNYNDHYGHPKGDECLRSFGTVLNGLRDSLGIYAARIGGEEFALLWFAEDRGEAKNVVARIQQGIRDLDIPHARSDADQRLSVSIGVCITPCGASGDTRTIYKTADNALYEAKGSGRNRAVVWGETFDQSND